MKQIKYEYIQRIPSHYVGKDCLQIMIPHNVNETTTFLNADGITYHYKENSQRLDNQYLTDDRRHQFPYSNVPTHIGWGRNKKIEYVNQLLDFNRVYLEIRSGMIIERYAIKYGDEALLALKFIKPATKIVKYMKREAVDELINSSKEMFELDGSLRLKFTLPTVEQVLVWYRNWLVDSKKQEQEQKRRQEMLEYGHILHNELDDYFYHTLDKLIVNDIPSHLQVKDLVLINTHNNEFESVQLINIFYFNPYEYKVEFYDYPITKYTLEHMEYLVYSNYLKNGEPRFPRMLNPHINHQEIKKDKQKILKLKK